ncbi:hypothetical protein U1839_02405 [Sphingomonas sp. RT2P30]|uniref:hypothetical protein n=1 Tax=Parasphingomonas halimpatiens TaxID=3096162 RepID=UPI002FC61E6A
MPLTPAQHEGIDPYFGLPLFLTEVVGSEQLWAYNPVHLVFLEAYLNASLRERAAGQRSMTMMARLPRWMKTAGARPKLRRAFAHLHDKAKRAGLS